MRKLLVLALLALVCSVPVRAQFGNTTTIRFAGAPTGTCAPLSYGINNATGALYDCLAGAWNLVGGGAAPASPGAPTGSVQYNNAGAFGGITGLIGNLADCGDTTPCMLQTTSSSTFRYILGGTNTNGPAGNFYDLYNFTDGGVYIDSFDGTNFATLAVLPTSSYLQTSIGMNATGVATNIANKTMQIGRLTFSSNYSLALVSGDFALGAGWGSTASVTNSGGADNNFTVEVTTGGAGIAANPTTTFTYKGGDFDTGSTATPIFLCSQTGGDDIVADVWVTRGQTSMVMTWKGTPNSGKKYEISCIGIQRN